MPSAPPPWLRLHLEPDEPIEVSDLTGALGALSRRYEQFAFEHFAAPRFAERPKLLVASVSPGSIDIHFVHEAFAQAATLLPIVHSADEFIKNIERLLSLFRHHPSANGSGATSATLQDCEDAIAIVRPIAQHGGVQTFNSYTGPITQVLQIGTDEARALTTNALLSKEELQRPTPGRMERVSLVWKRLDRDPAKKKGATPDKALIEEIDSKPRAVHFTDDMAFLKREMIADDENPYQKVYFVDVEVSRVEGSVTAYRIVGYHGKDDLDVVEPELNL